MRLIDADEIRYTSLKDGFGRIKECIAFSTDIDKQPTIDAIPIEWLKEFFASIEYEMTMNKEKITSDKIGDLVEYMIAKWDEEKGNWENG